jgi:twitching motility protein PilT
MNIDDLLRIAMERRASDLHLKVGNYPHLRVDGELVPLTDQPRVSAEDMLTMAFSMMSARQKQKFKETTEIDMAYGVAGLGRFRVNVFQQRGNVGLVLRVIPTKIRGLDELYLPKVVEQICDMPRGLVLVTGVAPVSRPRWRQWWIASIQPAPNTSLRLRTQSNFCIATRKDT